ncbi:MAG: glycerol-3-phosphate dehydrogenase/oxidase, partial [Planctomycetes bacterium]|nr:glycerol-3-phosphate dehydrogenase/oxidase [Planctomycetota bacterium]
MAAAAGRGAPWDLLVIGGGATGAGVAVDAAARGYSTLLLEGADFGSGTSSRSTKLVHGGVRYLQQGNVSLVVEALHERGRLRRNAPHLVRDLRFVVPNYEWWEAPWYGIGLKVYDLLAGRYGFGSSKLLSREQVLEAIPTLERDGLRGGVSYHDGQFDDARLLINLVQTAAEQGATVLNHAPVTGLLKGSDGLVRGAVFRDQEGGAEHQVRARAVVNATGPFVDGVRRLDDPAAAPLIAPSQGVHLVLDRGFLPGDTAIMVPRTRDKRVMFAIPWRGRTLLGTTDTAIEELLLEPRAQEDEVDFLLGTAADYLTRDPSRADVLALFTGIRPLVRAGGAGSTAALSRDHTVLTSDSGLITVCGGKWTTYRKMAEDVVEVAAAVAGLEERDCPTRELRVHGWREPQPDDPPLTDADPLPEYGADEA